MFKEISYVNKNAIRHVLAVLIVLVSVYESMLSQTRFPDSTRLETQTSRVIEERVVHHRFYRSPLWPEKQLTSREEEMQDRAFLRLMRSQKNGTSSFTTLRLADSLDSGESLHVRTCRTTVIGIRDSCATMEIITSEYSVHE